MERRLKYLNHVEFKKLVPTEIDTVLVPVGTIEAHGITPLGTDVLIPEAMAEMICGDVDAIVAPTVPYGVTRGLAGHPGTLSVHPDVFRAYVGDVVRSLVEAGFVRIVVLNGHGGQTDDLKDVLYETSREMNVKTLLVEWWYETDEIRKRILKREGGHAGADETACVMAIDPSLVKPDLYDERMTTAWSKAFAAYPFPGTIISYTEGDASLNLDEEECKAYFEAATARVTSIIKEVFSKWDAI
jgi:creatinine amidohydrolase